MFLTCQLPPAGHRRTSLLLATPLSPLLPPFLAAAECPLAALRVLPRFRPVVIVVKLNKKTVRKHARNRRKARRKAENSQASP